MATTRNMDELQNLRSKLSYWTRKKDVRIPEGQEKREILRSDITADIEIKNPDDARYGQKVSVPMFRTGAVAKLFKKGTQTIRQYERSGIIPDSGINAIAQKDRGPEKRGYTYDQFITMFELLPLLNFPDERGMAYSVFSRELWRRWAMMPDGVVVEPKKESGPKRGKPRRRQKSD